MFFSVLLLLSSPSSGQLLGHFGFVELPEGFDYRDAETVEASKEAARFWQRYQAGSNRRLNGFNILSNIVPDYKTKNHGVRIGKKKADSRIFDRFDTNFLQPLTETRSNKPLEEILVEDHTSRIRLLPGEGLPPTPAPPTRLPVNRLQNLNVPVEESERAKNSRLGSIFDTNPARSSSNSNRDSAQTHLHGFKNINNALRFSSNRKHAQDQLNGFKKTNSDENSFRFSSDRNNGQGKLNGFKKTNPDTNSFRFSPDRNPVSSQLNGFAETKPAASFFGALHASG